MSRIRLTRKTIKRIAELLRTRTKVKDICYVIGCSAGTYARWRERGEQDIANAEETVYSELVRAIESVDDDIYNKAVKMLYSRIFDGTKEVQRLRETITDEAGKIRIKETETEKDSPSSFKDVLTFVERIRPEEWAPIHRVQIGWRDAARAQGVDPDELMANLRAKMFPENENEEEVIPEETD